MIMMPSSMTHTYFGLDVYNKLPTYCKNYVKDSMGIFKGFCQGADPFMFYHFFIGKKARMSLGLQSDIHMSHTQEFFVRTVHSIFDNGYLNDSDVMSYLFGYICHYYLDLYAHPFIYYKSGIFKKDDKNTYCYNGKHEEFEYNIDLYMINKRENVKSSSFKIYNHLFDVSSFSSALKKVIDDSIGEIYECKDACKLYLSSFRYMKMFFHFFNYDSLGIKLKIYRIIDKITPASFKRLEELSFYRDYNSDLSYLNLEHSKWVYPWDDKKVFYSSFFDLYDDALESAVLSITSIVDMFRNNKINDDELKKIFPDLSYVTGLSCHKKVKMKFFEY